MLAQDVAEVRMSDTAAFVLFPPSGHDFGHIIQHLEEYKARAVILISDNGQYSFLRVANVPHRSFLIARRGERGRFVWLHHQEVLHLYVYG